jgi:hypothetical protein
MTGAFFGPIEVLVNCREPECKAEAVVWSSDPTQDIDPVYTAPPGWYVNDEERVAWCPDHLMCP